MDRMPTRRSFCFLGLGTLAACSSDRSGERPRLVVSTPPYATTFPIYVAHEAGYFSSAGLDVVFQEQPSSATTTALVAGGEVDVAFNAFHPSYINLIARGARMRYVAGREIATAACPNRMVLYGRADVFPEGFTDLRQLEGKRFSVTRPANIGEFSIDTMLDSVGLSTSAMQMSYLREADAAAALISGQIDAMIGSQSDHNPAFVERTVRGPSLADVLPGFQFSFAIFGERLLDGDPEIGTSFLYAYLRGARDYLNGATADYVDAFASARQLDPDSIRAACRETFAPDGRLNPDSFQRFVAWAVRKGYCEEDAAAAQIYDPRFIDAAAERLEAEA